MHGLGMIITTKIDKKTEKQLDQSSIAGFWKRGSFVGEKEPQDTDSDDHEKSSEKDKDSANPASED